MSTAIVYRLPVRTAEEISHAERRQAEAYDRFNSVTVEPDGIDRIKIVCRDEKV